MTIPLRRPLTAAVLALAMSGKAGIAGAQTAGVTSGPNIVALSGKITDARNLPIAGAVITARGASMGWTATHLDGSYVMTLAPGSYDLVVRVRPVIHPEQPRFALPAERPKSSPSH